MGFQRGHTINNGRKRTQAEKDHLSKVVTGRKHTQATKDLLSSLKKGKPTWVKGKRNPKVAGVNSNFWKGGVTSLKKMLRASFEYRQWRSDVFTRDSFTCQECGIKGVYLHAHHKKALSVMIKDYSIKTMEEARAYAELWNINNGQTLCEECHKKTDSYFFKARKMSEEGM